MKARPAQQIQILFEVSRDLLAVIGPDRLVEAANPAWEHVLGRSPESLIGTSLMDLVHPDDLPQTIALVTRLRAGENDLGSLENRYRHVDGSWRWLRWSSVTARHEDGFTYVAAHDFTSEREAITGAREAVSRMERSQRVAHVGSWERDLRTRRLTYSPEMYNILELDPERDAPLGLRALLPRISPQHHHRVHEALDKLFAEPGVHELEYEMVQPRGRVIWTLLELDRDADGQPTVLRGTSQDITALRENERRLEAAERVAGIGSFELHPTTGFVVWSPGTYRVYDRDPSEGPIGLEAFWERLNQDDPNLRRHVRTPGDDGITQWELEYPWLDAKGRQRILLSRGETDHRGDEEVVRGTVMDVTRDRNIRRQQQEIARLGQLALAGTDLRLLFEEVCRVTIDALGTDMVTILALQSDGSYARAASLGVPNVSATHGGIAIPHDRESLVRVAMERGEPMVVPDWELETELPYTGILKEHGLRCTMVLPIHGRDEPWGALTAHTYAPGVEDPETNIAFLGALGSFLATAIERARHETEIAALATLRGRLVAENLEAEERVRQRISEQLHDGALQDLLAARQDLVEAATEESSHAMRTEMLGYAREGVERAVKLLREAVHALHPVVLQHGGLEAAMQAAADQAARQGGFRAEVTVDPAATGLRDELVMSLARELLNNCAKHAQADHVNVLVGREDGMVLLEVADDGVGLDPRAVEQAPMNGHIGLASLAQRVEAVGGTLALGEGASGGGTTVAARLPIG
ncbi:PAS domain-containing protein [Baekduia sp. Peel2402]|uniref:PAS domain-containing protein n=1 Tax=Baekduia sp. Peel2402 TaxID=3458296 RepID=UPI00403E6928